MAVSSRAAPGMASSSAGSADKNTASQQTPSSSSGVASVSNNLDNTGNAASPAVSKTVNSGGDPNTSSVGNVFSQTTADTSLTQAAINDGTAGATPNATGNGASSMPKSLASPTFSSGPNNDYATVDTYSASKTTTPVNKISDKPAAAKKNIVAVKNTKTSKSSVGELAAILKTTAKDLTKVNQSMQQARLNMMIPKIALHIRMLPPGCGDFLTKGIMRDLNLINSIIASLNGRLMKVPTADLKCLIGIANMLGDVAGLTDSFLLKDTGAEIAGFSNLISSALMIGLMGSYILAIGQVTNQKTKNAVASKAGHIVAKKSDLISLHDMSTHTSTGSLKQTNPSIIRDFTKQYNHPSGASGADIRANHATIIAAYNAIDPNWNNTTRRMANGSQSAPVYDLSKVMTASPSFQQTMIAGIIASSTHTELAAGTVPNQHLLIAASLMPANNTGSINIPNAGKPVTAIDVHSALASSFPSTVLSANNNNKKTVTPLTLKTIANTNDSTINTRSGSGGNNIGLAGGSVVVNADGSHVTPITFYNNNGTASGSALI